MELKCINEHCGCKAFRIICEGDKCKAICCMCGEEYQINILIGWRGAIVD